MNIQTLIESHIRIDGEIDALNQQIKNLELKQADIQVQLLAHANSAGVKSFSTEIGTAFVDVVDFVSVANWDEFFTFVKEGDAFEYLNHAANKTAVKEYIEKNNAPPPGINYITKRKIKIRRKS